MLKTQAEEKFLFQKEQNKEEEEVGGLIYEDNIIISQQLEGIVGVGCKVGSGYN